MVLVVAVLATAQPCLATRAVEPERVSHAEPIAVEAAQPAPVVAEQSAARVRKDDEAVRLFLGVVTIPLLPVRLVDAISEGSKGVRDVGEASKDLVTVAQEMPRNVRGELRLAVDETLDRPEVRQAVQSMSEVSRSSERFAAVAERLPEVLERQSVQLDRSLQRAEAVSASIERATTGFADAGRAWTGAVQAVQATVELYQSSQKHSGQSAGDESSFRMADVVQTSENLAATAQELRRMIEQANALIGSDALRQRLDQVNSGAQQTVRATAGSATAATGQLVWQITQLAIVIFLLAVLWRLVCCELHRREHAVDG